MFRRRFPNRFPNRYRRKHFFPFWIFAIFFFVFMGKSGWWGLMIPFFLVWMFGPMLWAMSSGTRRWEEERDWKPDHNPIPPQWQTPPPPSHIPSEATNPVQQPAHSMAGLPNTCANCGGPINMTTIEWRTNTPHCGFCGTNLK